MTNSRDKDQMSVNRQRSFQNLSNLEAETQKSLPQLLKASLFFVMQHLKNLLFETGGVKIFIEMLLNSSAQAAFPNNLIHQNDSLLIISLRKMHLIKVTSITSCYSK